MSNADACLKHMSGSMMSWAITNRCHMHCRHCLNRSNDAKVHDFSNELNVDDCNDLIKQIAELRPYSMCICGGEPTLAPYLFIQKTVNYQWRYNPFASRKSPGNQQFCCVQYSPAKGKMAPKRTKRVMNSSMK